MAMNPQSWGFAILGVDIMAQMGHHHMLLYEIIRTKILTQIDIMMSVTD
jgi:hypothetical protein